MDPTPENAPIPTPPGIPPPQAPGALHPARKEKTWLQKLLAPLGMVGVVLLKLLAQFKTGLLLVLKFGWPFLKTGGSMLFMIWVYAQMFGAWFAWGFVILIFIHECGHLIVAKYFGLRVGWPVFIPFMGAFIALKEAPRNAWIEAWVGIGGPIFGSFGAAGCEVIYLATGNPMYRALAYTGFFLNLFNLIPLGQLDGGRIATAISPWLWLLGFAMLIGYAIYVFSNQLAGARTGFMLVFIIVLALPRLFSLFRRKSAAEQRFYEISAPQRLIMAVMYFGLIALLVLGMGETFIARD